MPDCSGPGAWSEPITGAQQRQDFDGREFSERHHRGISFQAELGYLLSQEKFESSRVPTVQHSLSVRDNRVGDLIQPM
jgi:hypothetical protein